MTKRNSKNPIGRIPSFIPGKKTIFKKADPESQTENNPTSNNQPQKMLTAGEVLSKRRIQLGLSLKKISQETKVQERYLSQIEKDDFDSFDSKVFVNGFIKIYADYLGLDVEKVSALYRRSIKEDIKKPQINKPVRENGLLPDISKLLTPQNVIILTVILFLLGLGGYLSYQFYNFQKAPLLTIHSPTENVETPESTILIKGKTEEGVTLTINESEINLEDDLSFSHEINLNQGTNTVSIAAIKKSNSQNVTTKVITVTYTPQQEDQEEVAQVETPPENFIANLTIANGDAWVQFSVDNSQKAAQVLKKDYSEDFEFTDEVTLITGRPSNTQLKINNEPVELTVDYTTGTARVTCSISNNTYYCN